MPKRKSKDLTKTCQQSLARINNIAKLIVSDISTEQLAKRVAARADITETEASELIRLHSIDKEVHRLLVDQVTEGAIAIKAMELLNKKMEEGDLEAAKIVIGFNSQLKPHGTRMLTEMNISDNRKVFINLDEKARKLLDEGDIIDGESESSN